MFMVSVLCLYHLSGPSLHSPPAHILWTLVAISLRSVPGFIPPPLLALLPTAAVDQIKQVRLSPHTHLPGRPPSHSLSPPSLTHSTCQVRRKPIQYHWIQCSVLLCSFPNRSLALSTVPSYLRYHTSHCLSLCLSIKLENPCRCFPGLNLHVGPPAVLRDTIKWSRFWGCCGDFSIKRTNRSSELRGLFIDWITSQFVWGEVVL